ncbi:hypothetical protein L6250_02625 [Candidatus Parcubacteria bacterium]|nr:hypothetical protein [Patescibacteria group bacterium]MBU4467004.1 hypothetical protein [Patescibacteria group bacterium]MCG2688505.1 hypothetical protein [Candidatus Parcubacteria bacterium]
MSKGTLIIIVIIIIAGFGYWFYKKYNVSLPKLSPTADIIKELFAVKYNKEISEITIEINKETEANIVGLVQFSPAGPENSGTFLAAKVDNNWKLIYDGQGAVPCLDIEPYNFPVDQVLECINLDGDLIQR